MGAAPSRETHHRGLFLVPQNMANNKQDLVMIPLTREFFPSPDCPLFVQFHKARCSAAVNYYFRRPGNPGDLSRIPNYADAFTDNPAKAGEDEDGRRPGEAGGSRPSPPPAEPFFVPDPDPAKEPQTDPSYPSREALYRGVIDTIEDALFDTDEEMREAAARERAGAFVPHPSRGRGGGGAGKVRRVLPVMCAVAFRQELTPNSSSNNNNNNTSSNNTHTHKSTGLASPSSPSFAGGAVPGIATWPTAPTAGGSEHHSNMNNSNNPSGGVVFGKWSLSIVGCFGFVSVQDDVEAAWRESCSHGGTPLGSPRVGSFRETASHLGQSVRSSECSRLSLPTSRRSLAQISSAGLSFLGNRALMDEDPLAGGLLMTLPASAAAPLAAMVFLTKSAGEQKLAAVTYVAASTYYFQLIQAGVIARRPHDLGTAEFTCHPKNNNTHPNSNMQMNSFPQAGTPRSLSGSAASPYGVGYLPLMEMFSFSSLITNIPVLSFLYEMKCRWGYLGVLRTGTPTATGAGSGRTSPAASVSSRRSVSTNFSNTTTPNPNSGALYPRMHAPSLLLSARGPRWGMGLHSSGGLALVEDSAGGKDVTDEMEMWITPDQMLHGRISSDLAARLCWSLVERPEVIQERVGQLPSEEAGYWRYRGLVDRAHPPPLPTPASPIDPKEVYVMGRDVLPGFDEGDILRWDGLRKVWFADHGIPLEGVVLAAMRPACKRARESPPDDPGWVTRLVRKQAHLNNNNNDHHNTNELSQVKRNFPVPPPTPEQAALLAAHPGLYELTHESMGNFFVYRFERDGTVYYHGTVPDFANPNKRNLPSLSMGVGEAGGGALPRSTSLPNSPHPLQHTKDNNNHHHINHPKSLGTSTHANSSPGTCGCAAPPPPPSTAPKAQPRQSILNALFVQARPVEPAKGVAQASAKDPAASTHPTVPAAGVTPTSPPRSAPESGVVGAGSGSPPHGTALLPGRDGAATGTGTGTGTGGNPPPNRAIPADYLVTRMTSAALETARAVVRHLYNYAYHFSTPRGAGAGSGAVTLPPGTHLTPTPTPTPTLPPNPPIHGAPHGNPPIKINGSDPGTGPVHPHLPAPALQEDRVTEPGTRAPALRHVRVRSRGEFGTTPTLTTFNSLTEFDPGLPGSPAAGEAASEAGNRGRLSPKRYTEKGSYLWDWRLRRGGQ